MGRAGSRSASGCEALAFAGPTSGCLTIWPETCKSTGLIAARPRTGTEQGAPIGGAQLADKLARCARLAPASINLRLSTNRKLAAEAAENGLPDRSVVQGIASLKGIRQSGDRAGNWEQVRDLRARPQIETTEGKRDRAILAVLLGCALRRSELASGARVRAHPTARRPLGGFATPVAPLEPTM